MCDVVPVYGTLHYLLGVTSHSVSDHGLSDSPDDTVDTVKIGMLCDSGTAAREECDAGRAAIDAINNKNDGYFDDLLSFLDNSVSTGFLSERNRTLLLDATTPELLLDRLLNGA